MATDLIKEIEKQIVKTDSLFSVDESFNDERFMRVRIAAMHSGINRNNSSFSTDVIKAAKDTFANIPILADVQEYEDEDGNKYLDYSGHSMHIEEDAFNDKNSRMIYDEKVVGIVPESNNFEIITDVETGNDYVYVDALLYREYGNYVCDILESRDNKTDVSMEIGCDDVSYSAKDKCLVVNKMTACAITLLGDHVSPGMAKAHAEVFSMNNDDRQNQLIQIMQELKQSLDNYTVAFATQKSKEGGNNMFEALLEKYGKTVEDITFEYENLSDEELETAFAEAFAETSDLHQFHSDLEVTENEDPAPASEDNEDVVKTEEPELDEEKSEESVVSEENSIECSVSIGEYSKKFSVSLNDKLSAISQLVNDTYADDFTWYDCTVYDDSKEVVMVDYWNGKAYRQSYKVRDDVFSLKGDRIPVTSVWMTADEQKAFEKMKAEFSDISEKLAKYEEEPKKMEILNSDDYNLVCESEEFMSLKEVENHFDLSVEEVEASADKILNTYAKTCGRSKDSNVTFSEVSKENVSKKTLANDKKVTKENRYGNLFSVIK